MTKIAVTGGSGFIGTQLCTLLRAQGHEIVIIDIRPSEAFPEARLDVDVRDLPALSEALKGCEVVYHLAAEHRDDVLPVSKYYDVNVEGGKKVVKAAEENGINTIVFTSTVAVYGLNAGVSTEHDTPAPFNDYGRSKLESEQSFTAWAAADPARRLVTLRLVATFGPGNRGNIYRLLRQIARRRFVMIGRGGNRKSIAYVGNVAAFLAHMLTCGAGAHLYNYADKPDLSMKEFLGAVRKILGLGGWMPCLPYLPGLLGGMLFDLAAKITGRSFPISAVRVRKFCADTQVSADHMAETGFAAPYTLREGLAETLAAEFGAERA